MLADRYSIPKLLQADYRPLLITYLLISIMLCCDLAAQNLSYNSPRSGMLGIPAATESSEWALFANPAGTAHLEQPVAGTGCHNDFGIRELSSAMIFGCLPTSLAVFSAAYTYSGYQSYNIQKISATLSRSMAPWLNLGARFHYATAIQKGAETNYCFTMDAGLLLTPHPSLRLGCYTVNPAQSNWQRQQERTMWPTIFAASLAYLPHKDVKLELGVEKDTEYEPRMSMMTQYAAVEYLILRGAVSARPLGLALGTTVRLQSLDIDMGINHHEVLGFSSSIGFSYHFGSPNR